MKITSNKNILNNFMTNKSSKLSNSCQSNTTNYISLPKNSPLELLGKSQIAFKGFTYHDGVAETSNSSLLQGIKEKSKFDPATGNYQYYSSDRYGLIEEYRFDRATNTETRRTRSKDDIDLFAYFVKEGNHVTADYKYYSTGELARGFYEDKDGNTTTITTDPNTEKNVQTTKDKSGNVIQIITTEPEKSRQIIESFNNGDRKAEIIDLHTGNTITEGPLVYDIIGSKASGSIKKINLITNKVVLDRVYVDGKFKSSKEFSEKKDNLILKLVELSTNRNNLSESIYDENSGNLKHKTVILGKNGKYNSKQNTCNFEKIYSDMEISYSYSGKELDKTKTLYKYDEYGNSYIDEVETYYPNTDFLMRKHVMYQNGIVKEGWHYYPNSNNPKYIEYFNEDGERYDIKHFKNENTEDKSSKTTPNTDKSTASEETKNTINTINNDIKKLYKTASCNAPYDETGLKKIHNLVDYCLQKCYQDPNIDVNENSKDITKYRLMFKYLHPDESNSNILNLDPSFDVDTLRSVLTNWRKNHITNSSNS